MRYKSKAFNTKNLNRIAILRLSALGDVTMMSAVVRNIQCAYPQAKITWIIGKEAYSLLEGLNGVEFIVIAKPKSLRSYWDCYKLFKSHTFDVLLAAQASLRTNLLYPLINAPVKIGFDPARARDGHGFFVNHRIPSAEEHLLDGFMRFAQYLGVNDSSLAWDLPIDEEHREWARKKLAVKQGAWLAINPSASKIERNWLTERYAAVIDTVYKRWGVNTVLIGGPGKSEIGLSQKISEMTNASILNLTGETNLKQLAALLEQVDVLLSPDSGPAHIAAAVNTPVVGLYAVAPPELSAPYSSQDLVVNKYPEAVKRFLNQDPEKVSWGKRVHNPEAMSLIQTDEVIDKLEQVLM